jgi:hypothetical protein
VRIVALRLSPAKRLQCQALRAEAGRVWTDLLTRHARACAQGQWLSAGELEQATKGGQSAVHRQSVQALCQKLVATVETATDLRRQELADTGRIQTASPHHSTAYQTVIWKEQALTVALSGEVRLPTGGQRPPLLLPLPEDHRQACGVRAVARGSTGTSTWRATSARKRRTAATARFRPTP